MIQDSTLYSVVPQSKASNDYKLGKMPVKRGAKSAGNMLLVKVVSRPGRDGFWRLMARAAQNRYLRRTDVVDREISRISQYSAFERDLSKGQHKQVV